MTVRAQTDFNTSAFRQALGHFPTGVCVVTSVVEGVTLGMTVSSFNSLSLDPPLILFSIDGRAPSLPQWERARGYAVNVLAENQKDVSDRFARSRSRKWEGMSYSAGFLDAPVLPGVAAVLECAAWAQHDGGDHVLFIAEVKRFRAFPDRRPLVFSKGRYAELHQTQFTASLWLGRGGHVANSYLGNGILRPETFGKTRQELPLRIAGPLLRPVLGEASY